MQAVTTSWQAAVGFADRHEDDHLVDAGSVRPGVALQVGDEGAVDDARHPGQSGGDGVGIGHRRDHLRMHEGRGLDLPQSGIDQAANEFDLVRRRPDAGFILQAIARPHFDDPHPCRHLPSHPSPFGPPLGRPL
jgi:hypothetical protein